jgi:hypothetical protein
MRCYPATGRRLAIRGAFERTKIDRKLLLGYAAVPGPSWRRHDEKRVLEWMECSLEALAVSDSHNVKR